MAAENAQELSQQAQDKVSAHMQEMKASAANLRYDFNQLKREFGSLVSSLIGTGRDSAQVARQKLTETAATAKDRMSSGVETGTEQLTEAWSQAKDYSADAVKVVEEKVAQNPMAALAIAAGVGLLVGAMMRRR